MDDLDKALHFYTQVAGFVKKTGVSQCGPVRAFAENQPVTSIVNTTRALFEQQPVGGEIWIALAWCVGIVPIAYALAMVTHRRKLA